MIRRLICGLTALMLCTGVAYARQESTVPALVRLHIVAADNSARAQMLKLRLRDAVLEAAGTLLTGCGSAEEAFATLEEGLPRLETAVEEAAARLGYAGGITAQTGVFSFPERQYAGVTVPAGEYPALRIVIGPGTGQNWWCVLYPSLCITSDTGYDSLFARWMKQWFGGDEHATEE
ncbi:MAG: stage II sporulation protein R [Christensenellales bacterium]|nr:stage II sporulation protein R [Christensenellales bacterium]